MEKPGELLAKKFFENTCNEAEYNLMMDYLNSLESDELKEFMDFHIKKIENGDISSLDHHEMNFQNVKTKIIIQNTYETHPRRKIVFFTAASIIFFILVSTSVLYYSKLFEDDQSTIKWKEKITNLGENLIITFLDGSKVTLNAKSKLKYPTSFTGKQREIYLDGEAYFEVQRDSSRPFIVHTGNLSTIVLGTKFNVNASQNEKTIEVSLIEGKVKIASGEQNNKKDMVILQPDQQLIYDKTTDVGTVNQFDELKVTGWKDGILKFDDESLAIVFKELEKMYGIKFEIAEQSYNNIKITANFKNESYLTIVEAIKKLTRLEYKIIKEANEPPKIVFDKKQF
jgi:ferric-dicitrate binding protein FerR (iron transport regulator)